VTAVARYALADYLRSQRFLPPLVAWLGFLAVLYAVGTGPVLPAFGLSSAVVLPVAAWTTVSLHNTEDPLQRAVTVVNARGHHRVVAGRTCAVVVCLIALTAAALVWPMAADGRLYDGADLAAGAAAHLVCGLTGIALGTCCARPVVRRQGHAFALACGLSLAALVGRRLSPANTAVRLLDGDPRTPPGGELALLTGAAVLMVVALAAAASWVARRRP
jgi:hypothetical protein